MSNNDFTSVPIENIEKYWSDRPCNINHSKKEFLSKEYFDEVEQKKYFVEPHIQKFADFEMWRGKKVLEIGCGLGTDSINFARHGSDLTIVELSSRSLEICKKRFEVFGLKAQFYEGNAENLELILPSELIGQFDLIYSFGVIHHSSCPRNIIVSASPFCKSGGELRIMLYARYSFKLFWIMQSYYNKWDFSQIDKMIAEYSEAQTGCPVTYTYTVDDVSDLLNGHFKITSAEKDHIFSWDIEPYKRNVYVKDSFWENVDESEFKKMEKELGWHLLIKSTKTD